MKHTEQIWAPFKASPGSNKKALENISNAFMVELAGTAPASAGLSWLVVYRHSHVLGLRNDI